MSHMLQTLVVFVCLGIAFTSSASRKEDLEKAAELVVEKAAERAAERAVEKALESGNTTTESKIVRESYSSRRKEPPRKRSKYHGFDSDEIGEDYSADRREISKEIVKAVYEEPEEEDWSKVQTGGRNRKWRRFPRRGWPYIDSGCLDESHEQVETINVKKKIPYVQEQLGRVQKRRGYIKSSDE